MSFNRIYKIEEELRSIKVVTPDDIQDAKNKLVDCLKFEQTTTLELKNTKTKFESQLVTPSALSNHLAVIAIIMSVAMGSFSLSTSDKGFLAIVYLFFLLSITGLLLYFVKINSNAYKKCSTYTILIKLIDEILEDQNSMGS
ncbi:hypothetical protein [Paenibacillus sp. O199]|uniref:hypothetical protein n=1 Tax=Paenibacillus sp. O199 TaxID=1643925 RepID=UPI0007BF973E|nr:hypothetical protein [Paenibacillus sp. O199]